MDVLESYPNKIRRNTLWKQIVKNKVLLIMLLPGTIILLVNNYIPMFGIFIAFKDVNYSKGLLASKWIGLKNFEFFWNSSYAFTITRNTILYNVIFIVLGIIIPIFFAIALNELKSRTMSKFYQSTMFLPYFLSWVVVSYLVFALLGLERGFVNNSLLNSLGIEPIMWYSETKYWPFILTIANVWKYTGYNSVIYLAAIVNIDTSYYDAAAIDGAGKWKQIFKITIPMLTPLMTILTLLQVGRIFFADFGLFYNVSMNAGALYPVTDVIDTYVYRALMQTSDIGMASAVGVYQSFIGFLLVFISNYIVRRMDPEKALF